MHAIQSLNFIQIIMHKASHWNCSRLKPSIPFIRASNNVFHIQSGLLTISQPSLINMKIGTIKSDRLLK